MAGTVFVVSTAALLVVGFLVRVEERNARRLFCKRLRALCDKKIDQVAFRFETHWKHVSRAIVQLGWYYSIHSLLATLMRVLVSVYNRIEHLFEKNRTKTRELRKELKKHLRNTHLSEIATHKKETALTPKEQTELRHKKLEEDH